MTGKDIPPHVGYDLAKYNLVGFKVIMGPEAARVVPIEPLSWGQLSQIQSRSKPHSL